MPYNHRSSKLLIKLLSLATGCLLLTVFLSTELFAQDQEKPSWTDLTISPRRVEKPFLAYRLFPDHSKRQPGNGVVILLRTFSDKNEVAWDKMTEASAKYLKMSAKEFSSEKVREEVPLWYFEELRRAAFRKDAEWEYPIGEGHSHDAIIIPDVSVTRQALRNLAVHCRADIAEGKIDTALEKITVGLGLASHLDEIPFPLVKFLEAQSIGLFFDRVQELVQHQQSPNLYWALTALPDPLIDFQHIVDWERRSRLFPVPEIQNLKAERSEREWKELRQRLGGLQQTQSGGLSGFILGKRNPLQMDLQRAKRELPELKPSLSEKVEDMSEDELTVRYFVARYQIVCDRVFSNLLLPPHQAVSRYHRAVKSLKNEPDEIADTIPAVLQAYALVWKQRQRIDALRIVEALRDYAARHDGKLPKSLEEIEKTPTPIDVVSDKPFQYRKEGNVAYLSGEGIQLRRKKQHGIRYRIQLR